MPAVLGAAGVSPRVAGLLKILLGRRGKAARRRRSVVAALLAALGAAAIFTFIGIRISSLLPTEIPWPTNNRRGTPFWEEAGRKGIPSVVMHVPVTFPAVDYDHGRLISGLGVTDVRGRVGTPSYYTSDPFFAPKNKNEFSVELVRLESNKGTIETEVFGPYNKLFKEPPVIKVPMTLTVAADGGSLTDRAEGLSAGDAEGRRVVAVGRLQVPVQLPREDDGHRALPPRVALARDQALPLADSLQSGGSPPFGEDHGARGSLEEARGPLRPFQDDGLADRHVVDERGDDRREDVPRGRGPHGRAVPEDDERLPRRQGRAAFRPDLRVPRPRRALLLALPRSAASRVRRREGRRVGARRGKDLEKMDDDRGRRDEKAGARGHPDRPVRPRIHDVAARR